MGLINFVIDVLRKLIILVLSLISIILIIAYFCFYDKLNDPNIMLWIIVVPMFFISLLVKKK